MDAAELVVVLAAITGAIAALAAREALRAAPALRSWLEATIAPLMRAGREGYAPSAVERRRLAVLAGAILLAAGLWLLGPLPALPLVAAAPAAVSWALGARQARFRGRVERGLPALALGVADGLAAGRSIRTALGDAAGVDRGPVAVELARVEADLGLGVSVERALAAMAARVGSSRVDSFCAALLSQRIAGGDLVVVLRRFAAATAERARAEADARTATAQARFTGLLVVAMPVGAGLLAELASPGFIAAIASEPAAAALVGAAALLQLGGFVLIRRLGATGSR